MKEVKVKNVTATNGVIIGETPANPKRILECVTVVAYPPMIIPILIKRVVEAFIRKEIFE